MPNSVTDGQISNIPGWFYPFDWRLFEFGLTESARQIGRGDLAEIGAYLGKSAVLIGAYKEDDENFTVIDLFGGEAIDSANLAENSDQYSSLTRSQFEDNYRRVHGDLPTVVQAPSSDLPDHAAHGTHRFVHVDGSHLYDVVAEDVSTARTLLHPQGLVVFDDYRSPHTPGVAAAVWEAVFDGGLHPLWMNEAKLYGTWGDPQPWLDAFEAWVPESGLISEKQTIAKQEVYRLKPGKRMFRQMLASEAKKWAVSTSLAKRFRS